MLRHEALNIAGEVRAHPQREPSRFARATAVQILLLLLSDLCALLISAVGAFALWAHAVLHQPISIYLGLSPLLIIFPTSYAVARLYPGFGLGAVESLRRTVHCTNVSMMAIAAASFVFQANAVYSRMTFVIFWMVALVAVPMCRLLVLSIVSRLSWWGEPAVIFGRAREAKVVIRLLRRAFSLGYRVVGVVTDGNSSAAVEGVPVLGGIETLPKLSRLGVTTCLVLDRSDRLSQLTDVRYQRWFRHVVLVRDWKSLPIENVALRNLGGVLGIDLPGSLLGRGNQFVKRAIDVLAGAFLCMLSLPVILFFGFLVKLASPGPIWFTQERVGLSGKTFRVRKLRTMHPDGEKRLAAYLGADPELARQWRETVKLVHDPRVIPGIGQFIRRFSIDELPQLFSVMAGRMSLVGPRPFPEYHLSRFSDNFRNLRAVVRPGLSGMWQVMIRSEGNLEQQEMYDTYYIRNWSLWLDIYILARTVFAVIIGAGAR